MTRPRVAGLGAALALQVAMLVAPMILAPAPSAAALSASAWLAGGLVPVPGGGAALPLNVKLVGSLAPSTPVGFDVVLRPRDPTALERYAEEVSTPGSDLYRHYLARGAFAEHFGPTSRSVDEVEAWMRAAGLDPGPVSPNGLVIQARSSAGQIRLALGTELVEYRTAGGRTARAPASSPEVPRELVGIVQAVVGLSNLARPRSAGILRRITGATSDGSGSTPEACAAESSVAASANSYTAEQVAGSYSFRPLYAEGMFGQATTVAVFELEPYLASDVAAYESCNGEGGTVSNVYVDGGSGSGAGSGEAAMDIETISALAPAARILVYEGPDSGQGSLDVYNAIAASDTAQVVSTSWGLCEPELGGAEISAEATIFEEMAAQGQTVLASAGDAGSEDCYTPGGTADSELAVDDPGSQPWVTSVGGTTMTSPGPPPVQSVWNDQSGAGGGGVSEAWQMPSWQTGPGVVNAYSTGVPCGAPAGAYCREVPDVSALADPDHGIVIFYEGSWAVFGGTSLGPPVWAALVALADGGCPVVGQGSGSPASSTAGQPATPAPVGFMNPAIYRLASGGDSPFDPVTEGDNQYFPPDPAPSYPYPPGPYFPATSGYSLAAGWGTPVASALVADLEPGETCPPPEATGPPVPPPPEPAAGVPPEQGYWVLADGGRIWAYGNAGYAGSQPAPGGSHFAGMAPVPGGGGYWLAASDGIVEAYGDARFYGSMAGRALTGSIVGIAADPAGTGYWLLSSTGEVMAFGSAAFYGSPGPGGSSARLLAIGVSG